jgi:HPt (histidine-containing phosphotransfer) domain-containing protein
MKKMILLFIETVPQNVQEMVVASQNSNWEQTAKMAHKLKSTVDSMGIKTIHDDIRLVESNAKQQKELDQIPSLVNRIERVIDRCILQLKAEAGSTQ